jgi:hypothetical protein
VFKCRKGERQGLYIHQSCGQKFNLNQAKLIDIKPVLIGYKCKECSKIGLKCESSEELIKELDEYDMKLYEMTQELIPPYYFPKHKLYYPSQEPFLTKRRAESVDELFDRRSLVVLSVIYHEINKICDPIIKDLLRMAFSASLEFVCRLNPLRPKEKEKGYTTRSGLTVHELWIPAVHCINNPLIIFTDRVKKVIKGKEDAIKEIKSVIFAKSINDILSNKAHVLLINDTVLNLKQYLCNKCPKSVDEKDKCQGCVDCIITDPPYGGSIQTYELDFFRNAWLFPDKLDFWKYELVINEKQGKNIDYYYNMLREVFQLMYRVLKPGHYMIVTFHSSFIDVYNSIIRASFVAGFNLEKIVYQPPAIRSAKQSLHPYTSAVGDYYIRFKKPEILVKHELPERIDESIFEREVVKEIESIIAERGEPTSITDILKEIYPRLEKKGFLLYAEPERIKNILEKYGEEYNE